MCVMCVRRKTEKMTKNGKREMKNVIALLGRGKRESVYNMCVGVCVCVCVCVCV